MRSALKPPRIADQPTPMNARATLDGFIRALLLALVLALLALPSRAGTPWQSSPGPLSPPAPDAAKPQPQESSSKRPEATEPAEPAQGTQAAPAGQAVKPGKPNYNPLDSEKDVEVGLFYMHKGDVDAAIPRFEDAISLRANYAKPRLLLGQAYEKKKDYSTAVKYYKEYLQVFPDAPDAKQVQHTIEKLSKK
jgi:tetratricopeptide (TPR) repeat protein